MYPLRAINTRLQDLIGACYSHGGLIDNTPAVYSPYSTKSGGLCSSIDQVSLPIRPFGYAQSSVVSPRLSLVFTLSPCRAGFFFSVPALSTTWC